MTEGEIGESPKKTTKLGRREAMKLIGGTAAASALALTGCEGEVERRSEWWGQVYTVKSGDNISSIAAMAYPDYVKTPKRYEGALGRANGNPLNPLLRPGQELYIPNPNIPTYGLRRGDAIVLKGESPLLKVVAINYNQDPQKETFEVEGRDGRKILPVRGEQGRKGRFDAAGHRWGVGAVLKPTPGYENELPGRVILEDLGPAPGLK